MIQYISITGDSGLLSIFLVPVATICFLVSVTCHSLRLHYWSDTPEIAFSFLLKKTSEYFEAYQNVYKSKNIKLVYKSKST